MMHEQAYHKDSMFATLTYSDDHLPNKGSLDKMAVQRMLKRLRKMVDEKIKYYIAGEYGEKNGRPHYHAIIYGMGIKDKNILETAWPYGMVHAGMLTYDSARYCADYVHKKYSQKAERWKAGQELPWQLVSKGLGKKYCLENASQIVDNQGITVRGHHVGIPRYYAKQLLLEVDKRRERAIERDKKIGEYFEKKIRRNAEKKVLKTTGSVEKPRAPAHIDTMVFEAKNEEIDARVRHEIVKSQEQDERNARARNAQRERKL